MKRTTILIALGAVALVAALSAYVGVPAAHDLQAARASLSGLSRKMQPGRLVTARRHLLSAENRLRSPAAFVLRLVPVVRQNVDTLRAVSGAGVGVVDAAIKLARRLEELERGGVTRPGGVRIRPLEALAAPLHRQATALRGLERALESHRNGWLIPPLWDRVDTLEDDAEEMRATAETAARVIDIAPALLGDEGRRRYLVLLINNTELRGAGGILSGVGSLSIAGGKIELGSFTHYKSLADPPPFRRVPAPRDFRRHFHVYQANTTRWVATTSSPDVPDVAIVARRLYALTAGRTVDGVLVVDPQGLSALLPPRSKIRVPTTNTVLRPDDVPEYVYSKAYEELGGGVARRRESLIEVGQSAFNALLGTKLDGSQVLRNAAAAAGGGHLRVVTFDDRERRALDAAGITGELGTPREDGVLATIQNLGGNKLDFYARRTTRHSCRIRPDIDVLCETAVTIENHTPPGLTRYEYQYLPYGLFKNFLEIYVPKQARLEAVTSAGEPVEFITYREDGYRSVGVYLEIPQGDAKDLYVRYSLPPAPEFSSLVRPQPQTHAGRAEVRIFAPESWDLTGPAGSRISPGRLSYEGRLDSTLKFEAGPYGRTGLAAIWAGISSFWRNPLF